MILIKPEEIDRIALCSDLRGAGHELAHIGSMIAGRGAVEAFDLRQARGAIKRALDAIDHFERRSAASKETT
ncbi:hypothetical protein [Inquilinus sp. CA228]|uniref:hypothetical protein n=1 Tax=Inquilinus sp. CA228 TaxID=3455609 RepID=UPI003F8D4528